MNGCLYNIFMNHARDPYDETTSVLAGVLTSACSLPPLIPPLTPAFQEVEIEKMLGCYFPGVSFSVIDRLMAEADTENPPRFMREEFESLVELLLDHSTRSGKETVWLAQAIAIACMGGNHLWQDMGLPNRQALSTLLAYNFGPLYRRNVKDMKWKKFFYKQICEREGLNLCKAPNCEVCLDYDNCFGPEEDEGLILEGRSAPNQHV